MVYSSYVGDWVVWWNDGWKEWQHGKILNLRFMYTADEGIKGYGRRNFRIGWTGERIINNADIETINERYPGQLEIIHQWLLVSFPCP